MDKVRVEEGHYLVSPLVPELIAWVEVNGEPLKVYGAEVVGNKAIGYIEAKENQQFKVCYLDIRSWRSRPDYAYSVRLRLDANFSKSRLNTISGRKVSDNFERPFLFSKLATTDSEDLACNDEQVIKNLGTLQLDCRRATNLRQSTKKSVYKPREASLIHEKAKKAQLSHQASFAAAVPMQRYTKWACDYIDSRDSPFFSIAFRYRSRQLLQLEGHIPPSPAPSPEPSPSASPSVSVSPAPVQAQASNSPAATTSNPNRRSSSSVQPSQSSQAQSAEQERLARLEAELAMLQREQRITILRREIHGLKGELGASGSAGSPSSGRKIKAEPSDDQRDAKKVKRETGEESLSTSTSGAKGKGKGKQKAEVIELSDSD
ncbi:uncharacterized protein JCM6883_007463 [Sporobolomyces salmoneus]|uniref:uncharacterized protein n=1 Tax=Sporobolomyces salmoneus TaxID=183962 RepID=UPI00317A390E